MSSCRDPHEASPPINNFNDATDRQRDGKTEQREAPITDDLLPRSLAVLIMSATVRIENQAETPVSYGSGVVVGFNDGESYILTAEHVVAHTEEVSLTFFSLETYPQPSVTAKATVVARSRPADLAVLRCAVDDRVLPALAVANNEELVNLPGNRVWTVGCEDDEPPTILPERILAAERVQRPDSEVQVKMWQLQRAPTPGRSGGALTDNAGRVLGIASGASSGRGYFTHLDEIRRFLAEKRLIAPVLPD